MEKLGFPAIHVKFSINRDKDSCRYNRGNSPGNIEVDIVVDEVLISTVINPTVVGVILDSIFTSSVHAG